MGFVRRYIGPTVHVGSQETVFVYDVETTH